MTLYLSDSWQVGTAPNETFSGDRYGRVRNDVFQLAGSEYGTLGGIQNGWETFDGGSGYDKIYVAPKTYYAWTAIMIANNGLKSIESIEFVLNTRAYMPSMPIYFWGNVDFSSVTSMSSGVKIFGRESHDKFIGGILGETVEGDGGNDTLYGNGGNDKLFGDSTEANPWVAWLNAAGDDKLYGGDGDDYLNGQGGNDLLYGDAGDDEMYGGTGNDQLRGGAGDDKLFGESGRDVLDGGAGINFLWGGVGEDTFQFTSKSSVNSVNDFEVGSDRLRFHKNVAEKLSDLTIFDDANGYANISVGDVQISLKGVSAASLNSSMFEFGLYV